MEFLNITLLAGTLAGILPVVIHLIHRERPRLVRFTALKFIRQSARGTARGFRLKHLLLLLLRILLIVLFALVLARPFVRHGRLALGSSPVTQAVMLLDDSYLMGMKGDDGMTHFQRAQKLSSELIRSFPAGSSVALYLTSHQPFDFTIGLSSVLNAVELAQVTTWLPSCTLSLAKAYEALRHHSGALREIYVFSNFAGGVWRPMTVPSPEGMKDVRLTFVQVGPDWPGNLSLLSAQASSLIVDRNSPVRIDCEVLNTGPARKGVLDLIVEGQKRASNEVEFPAAQSTRISFPYEFHEPGISQGQVRITNADSLAVDNDSFFSVQVLGPIPVLLVARKESEKDALFVHHALSPTGLKGRERVELATVDPGEFFPGRLEGIETVFLINVPRLSAREWELLVKHVEQGGGLAVIFGESFDSEHYNNLPHLPIRILGLKEGQGATLTLGSLPHPLLDKFRREGLASLHLARFKKYVELAPPGENDSLLQLGSFGKHPALLEGRIGRGRILLFASSFSTDWSDLPKWPVFPPFLYEMVNYLAGRQAMVSAYHPGQPIPITVLPEEREAVLSVFEPGSDRPVTLSVSPGSAEAHHTASFTVGNAQVFIKTDRRTRKLGYSVNLDVQQDYYTPVGNEVLKRMFPQAAFLSLEDDLTRKAAESKRGAELTSFILALLVLLFCLESFLANRIYR